ncbi:hypothetical protein FKM82_025222 [Ascaphus truei]
MQYFTLLLADSHANTHIHTPFYMSVCTLNPVQNHSLTHSRARTPTQHRQGTLGWSRLTFTHTDAHLHAHVQSLHTHTHTHSALSYILSSQLSVFALYGV